MRVDHIAYRVADKEKTAKFFIDFLGYKKPDDLQDGFDIQFEDGTWAKCLVLEPPEKIYSDVPWSLFEINRVEYQLAPEIFVSDGSPGSIVEQWVQNKGGIGGIHHIAYQVASVEAVVEEWKSKGFAEFASEEPLTCPGLVQIFTKPLAHTGVIYEFIERTTQGFCAKNVKNLIESTKDNKF
jgi:catechol 2,3-dioxygenase-like lactoylglutathione lyase family enzyme